MASTFSNGDPSLRAIGRVIAKMEESGLDLKVAGIVDTPAVLEPVAYAAYVAADVDASDEVRQLMQRYVTETVALGSLIRAANHEPPMLANEVEGVRDFFKYIFNNIFRK